VVVGRDGNCRISARFLGPLLLLLVPELFLEGGLAELLRGMVKS
jgi:hypothetical protein